MITMIITTMITIMMIKMVTIMTVVLCDTEIPGLLDSVATSNKEVL
jgi:hypothetical protein